MINASTKYIYHFLIGAMLLFLVWFIWKIGLGIPSSYTDMSFHLATAQGFVRAGGITTWDFWESLPLGRPHNYPPLFHLVLASILKMGVSPSVAIKLMMEITVVGGLAVYAWGLAKLFNVRVAFWAVLMLFFSSHFIQLSATVMPATMVTFLVPALLYFVLEKKWLSYSALLIIMFYLHLYMPYFILLSMLIYLLIFQKKLLKPFLIASIISFVLYLPWLTHIILGGWEYIKYLDSNTGPDMWRKFVLVNLFTAILTVVGTVILFMKRKKLSDQYFFFLILAIIILTPSSIIAGRLLDSHFLVFAVILSTITIEQIWKSRARSFLAIPFVVYCWLIPTITLGDINNITFAPSIMNYNNILYSRFNYDPLDKFSSIIKSLDKKAVTGDSITTIIISLDEYPVDKNYRLSISNTIAPYANLSTLNLRQPEIYRRPQPDITKSKFLLTSASTNELDQTLFANLGYQDPDNISNFVKNNFEQISFISSDFDTRVYCYLNKNGDTYSEKIPPNKFPVYLGNILLLFFVSIIVYDNRKFKINDSR